MSEELRKEIGEGIRMLRVLLRLSYADLMQRSGVSSAYLRQVERGERDIGLDKLAEIAEGLGFELRQLIPDGGRSALASAFADAYEKASDEQRRAILYLLAEPDDSSKKEAIVSIVTDAEIDAVMTADHPDEPAKKR